MSSLRLTTKVPLFKQLIKNDFRSISKNITNRQLHTTRSIHNEASNEKPVKFTTSDAHLNYRASKHFYDEPRDDIPKSHNYFVALTGVSAMFYIIFIREDIDDNEGALSVTRPVFEAHPQYAIPMIESMIVEYRKYGRSTKDLEKKLAFYMKNPEAHGGVRPTKTLQEN